jgi:hypothetical protein
MFISFSKGLCKPKLRIGTSFRITSKNAPYMIIGLLFYWYVMLCIYIIKFFIYSLYVIVRAAYGYIKKILDKKHATSK